MIAVSTTGWWVIGSTIAGAVVVVAALLLLTIIALARRIATQADRITEAIDGARQNTNGLFDVTKTNLALDQITRSLATVRKGLGG